MFPLLACIIALNLETTSINTMKSFKTFLSEMAPPKQPTPPQKRKINCDLDGICRTVIQDESAGNEKKILKVYKDSKGLPTIAHGHLITPNSKNVLGQVIKDETRVKNILAGKDSITSDEAMGVLKVDVEERLPKLQKLIPSFETLSPELQSNLYSEYHRGMLQQSPLSVKKFNEGDYEGFAKNYVNAKDYIESKAEGTGIFKRMDRLVDAARTEAARQKERQKSSSATTQAPLNSSRPQSGISR